MRPAPCSRPVFAQELRLKARSGMRERGRRVGAFPFC